VLDGSSVRRGVLDGSSVRRGVLDGSSVRRGVLESSSILRGGFESTPIRREVLKSSLIRRGVLKSSPIGGKFLKTLLLQMRRGSAGGAGVVLNWKRRNPRAGLQSRRSHGSSLYSSRAPQFAGVSRGERGMSE
jgi:hypothetical protein